MAESKDTHRTNRIEHTGQLTETLLRSGKISRRAAAQIFDALGYHPSAEVSSAAGNQRDDFVSYLSGALSAFFAGVGAALRSLIVSKTEAAPKTAKAAHSAEKTDDIIHPPMGGVDQLLSFESLAQTLKPLFNEYVWWFVAMVLVISGSIMGIREAWLRFEGILRPFTILFAFFIYHTLFLGLGIFLYRKSVGTGKMLLIIAAALIPLMFSIAGTISRLSSEAGAAATGISLLLSLVTLIPLARRLAVPYVSAVLYLPVPFALGALAALGATIPLLTPVIIVALTAAALSATGLLRGENPLWRFAFAVTGIVILAIVLLPLPIAADDDLSRSLRHLSVMAVLGQFALLMRTLDHGRVRFFTALEITAYAIVAMIALVVSQPLSGNLGQTQPFTFRVLTLPLAIGIFLRAARNHNAAIHAVIFLTMCLLLRLTKIFSGEYATQVFAFFIFQLLIPFFARGFHENKKRIFSYWALICGILGSLAQLLSNQPHIAAAATGLLTAISIFQSARMREVSATHDMPPHANRSARMREVSAAHDVPPRANQSARIKHSAFHYLSPIGLLVFIARLPLPAGLLIQANEVFFALAVIYAIGGWIFERQARSADEHDSGYPLHDLSLICAVISVFAINTYPDNGAWVLPVFDRTIVVRPLLWLVTAWFFLLMRSVGDRSMVISTMANLALALGLSRLINLRDYAEAGIFLVSLALLFYIAAALLSAGGRETGHTTAQRHGRVFLFHLRLPFDAGGIANIGQGAAVTALALLVFQFFNAMNWIDRPDYSARGQILLAQLGFLVLVGAVFHFKVFAALRLRGSLAVLFTFALGIGLTAIINRLGRPLPMDVVGWRLLLMMPLLALVTLALKTYGPRYGEYLQAGKQAHWYFLVPVTGVGVLTLLLLYDAFAVSRGDFDRAFYFVPPTIYLALALYPLILTHTVTLHFRHLFYLFLPVFLAALFAEKSFLGPALSNANSAAEWLPVRYGGSISDLWQNFALALSAGETYLGFRQNIVIGFAAGVSLLALMAFATRFTNAMSFVTHSFFSKNSLGVSFESGLWSIGYTLLIALMSFQVASVSPGVILLGVAALYLAAGNVRASAFILFTGGLLIVHGGAHLGSVYPVWPGPVLALAAIAMILPTKKIAAKLDLAEAFVAETSFLAGTLYIIAAFFYAATEMQGANALSAGLSVLNANGSYVARGDYYRSPALVATLAITALYFRVALNRIAGRSRAALAAIASLFLSAALGVVAWLALSKAGETFTFLQAAPFALALVLVHQLMVTLQLKKLQTKDAERYAGYFTARDAVVIVAGIILVALSTNLLNPLPLAAIVTLITLALYLVLNITAAFVSARTRYVYVAQATIAGIYFSLRPLLNINSAQVDAFFAFGYAFALLGISIFAQRFSLTVVSEPTRRFAAILPVVVALIIDNFRTLNTAFLSLLSSGLYFLLSRFGEKNLFAALAAITLNAALFFVALSAGYDSSEFYAFPAGLTIIFFASIFKDSLSAENQARVRTIGGLIAYLPAAMHVTLRSGLAQNPAYSVVFGLVCLAGIFAGMLFRIRSYLFLGVLFFTLNIIANLVQEGLQNQFVGFVLLTLTGLLLITILIIYNLRKENIHSILRSLSERFARWR
ncbi:MAG: hypothetical protein JNJ69_13735 [Leptospiraceae bacterium]|nr:hypothetical protein [Leptospiraceae bacterium]